MNYDKVQQIFKPARQADVLINQLKNQKKDFYVRQTTNITQVVCDNIEIIFKGKEHNNLFPINQLFIFKMVRDDAQKWAKMNADFTPNPKYPTNAYNFGYDLDNGEVVGTDITSAYWYIAHKVGVLSNKTFLRLLHPKFKVVKLASLAVLGRQMVFDEYENGQKKESKAILQQVDTKLVGIYRHIRYECYRHMVQLSRLLGEDFLCYKTDCIYYRKSDDNINLVNRYLDQEGLEYSQVTYED